MTNSEHPSLPPTLTLVEKLYAVHNINSLIPEKLDLAESNYSTWSYFFKGHCSNFGVLMHIEDPVTTPRRRLTTVEWITVVPSSTSWIFLTSFRPLERGSDMSDDDVVTYAINGLRGAEALVPVFLYPYGTTSSAPQVLLAEASSRNQTGWNNRERDNRYHEMYSSLTVIILQLIRQPLRGLYYACWISSGGLNVLTTTAVLKLFTANKPMLANLVSRLIRPIWPTASHRLSVMVTDDQQAFATTAGLFSSGYVQGLDYKWSSSFCSRFNTMTFGHPKMKLEMDTVVRDNKCTIEFDEFGFSVKDYWTRQILLDVTSTDHFSHLLVGCTPLRNMSDALQILIHFVAFVKNQFQCDIKSLQCDHGGEFDNNALHQLFATNGITIRFSCPKTSQQNGKSERMIRTINNLIRTLLFQAHLPPTFWVEALHMAAHLLNILPSTAINNEIPHTRLYKTTPNYADLRVFGCLCYPHVHTNHKLEPRATPSIFLGYPTNHRGYRCLDLNTDKIILSRHVTFDETVFPYGSMTPDASPPYNFLDTDPNLIQKHMLHNMPTVGSSPVAATRQPTSPSPQPTSTSAHSTGPPTNQPTNHSTLQPTPSAPTNPTPTTNLPPTNSIPPTPPPVPSPATTQPNRNPASTHSMVTRYRVGTNRPTQRYTLSVSTISPIPKSYNHAFQDPHWYRAMLDEYNALIKNNTWILVPRPSDANIVRSLWLFRHKYNADGTLNRYKARLVANGSTQLTGIDVDETFSPVVKPATIRTVLSLALSRHWPVHQLDVKNAFLHGSLSETVYMQQPPGFRDSQHPDHVCLLQRSLYGLKQAPRAWFQRFAAYAARVGFIHSRCDTSLFIYRRGSDTAYLLLYVDDIILTASSTAFLQSIIATLHAEFSMTDLGPLNYFLGISVTRNTSGMFLSQQKYASELLERAGMLTCNPCRTPVDTDSKLSADGDPVSDPTLYRSLAGALQYLTFTRPDISYAVQQVCLYMHDPREPHFSALKRILRYIRGTMPYGLQLFSSTTSSLVAYSDADWAGCTTTRRSTSGYCVFLGSNLLSWSSKRQLTLSRSSAEAEYQGVANAVAETCWLHNLLRELHTLLSTATLIYYDNVSAIYLSSNLVQHQRMKHIEIDIHFVRDLVADGHIRQSWVKCCNSAPFGGASRYQYADVFTKGLPTVLFDEFRSSLSVRSSPAQTAGGYDSYDRPHLRYPEMSSLGERGDVVDRDYYHKRSETASLSLCEFLDVDRSEAFRARLDIDGANWSFDAFLYNIFDGCESTTPISFSTIILKASMVCEKYQVGVESVIKPERHVTLFIGDENRSRQERISIMRGESPSVSMNNKTPATYMEPLNVVAPSHFAENMADSNDTPSEKDEVVLIDHLVFEKAKNQKVSMYSKVGGKWKQAASASSEMDFKSFIMERIDFAKNTDDSNDTPSKKDKVVLIDHLVFEKAKNQKVSMYSKVGGKRNQAASASSGRETRHKTPKVPPQASKAAGEPSDPLDVDSDPDIHEFLSAKALNDSTDCHWVVAHVTPPSWKQHLKEINLDKLCDIHDKACMRQEKDKAYAELEAKCNDALEDLGKNPLVLDLQAEIKFLHGQEIDGLKQDRATVVAKVVPYVAIDLVRSDKMGLLVARLVKTALVHFRCSAFEEVAALKELFELEKMPGYRPFSKKEFDHVGDNVASASYPFLINATVDAYAPLEVLLSKNPMSFLSNSAPSQSKSKPSSLKVPNPDSKRSPYRCYFDLPG
ncbi:ribonuclease H-like domain-containing protein, partial [Tanacetum coccineum]